MGCKSPSHGHTRYLLGIPKVASSMAHMYVLKVNDPLNPFGIASSRDEIGFRFGFDGMGLESGRD